MDTASSTQTAAPPRLIPSLTAGFNLTASRFYLLLVPIALDLLLWFGPHFRLSRLVQPLIEDWSQSVQVLGRGDMLNMAQQAQQLWGLLLQRFNMLSFLSTLPIGVPSLLAGAAPVTTPLGEPVMVEVNGWGQALSGWLLFSLLGLVLGSLYFNLVARSTSPKTEPFHLGRLVWQTGQVLALSLLLILLAVLISIPLVLFTTVLAILSPGLAQLALLLMLFVLLWLLVPMLFTPHGIFSFRQNLILAMLSSARVVRAFLPGVSLFLLAALVLSQGLGYLWTIPPANSWLLLAGILGNAFISTGLLAASFIYYRTALQWVETLRRRISA